MQIEGKMRVPVILAHQILQWIDKARGFETDKILAASIVYDVLRNHSTDRRTINPALEIGEAIVQPQKMAIWVVMSCIKGDPHRTVEGIYSHHSLADAAVTFHRQQDATREYWSNERDLDPMDFGQCLES